MFVVVFLAQKNKLIASLAREEYPQLAEPTYAPAGKKKGKKVAKRVILPFRYQVLFIIEDSLGIFQKKKTEGSEGNQVSAETQTENIPPKPEMFLVNGKVTDATIIARLDSKQRANVCNLHIFSC